MKKAWELSVLCGADISILIFSAAGKAYEFSSADLDDEFDRYLEYEGLIERRRAAEFAAMAELGEDDEDDDDDDGPGARRKSAAGGKGKGAPASEMGDKEKARPKSLKGKEVYKVKMASRRDIQTADKRRRKRDREGEEKAPSQGFIEGLLSDADSSEGERRPENNVSSAFLFTLVQELTTQGYGQSQLRHVSRT
jgi:MADS-box transcription factor